MTKIQGMTVPNIEYEDSKAAETHILLFQCKYQCNHFDKHSVSTKAKHTYNYVPKFPLMAINPRTVRATVYQRVSTGMLRAETFNRLTQEPIYCIKCEWKTAKMVT